MPSALRIRYRLAKTSPDDAGLAGIGHASVVTKEPTGAVQLSWQPEVADYFEAFQARNRVRRVWHKVAVIAVLGAVFAVAAFALGQPGPAMVGVEAAVVLPLVVVPVTWMSTRSVWHRRPALRTATRAVVSRSAGITSDGALVDMSKGVAVTTIRAGLAWDSVEQVLETRRVFVVQLSGCGGKRFILLAKRGLADPAELDALRGILSDRRQVAG